MDLFSDSESSSGGGSDTGDLRSLTLDIIEKDGDSASGPFRINEQYAARFQHNNERAELQRLQEKHGQGSRQLDSSDSESEDEEGEQMTADVDAAILTTLARIRRKDESIYDVSKRVFDEERALAVNSSSLPRAGRKLKRKEGKSITLGQYQRERIQELIATSVDPAKELADSTVIEKRSEEGFLEGRDQIKTYADEEEDLRKEVTSAFHQMADDRSELFVRKDLSGASVGDDDEKDYRHYLASVVGGDESELHNLLRSHTDVLTTPSDERSPLRKSDTSRSSRTRKKDDDDEAFLANYILNRGWLDKGSSQMGRQAHQTSDGLTENVVEEEGFDDEFETRAEAFESAYNYRFQDLEEGKVDPQIQSYSRRIEGSARRQDNKRRTDREERKHRKARELEQKRIELDRLRDLKRKSITKRLAKLKKVTGSSVIDFEGFALDDEFDPHKHDKAMAAAFNDAYYGDAAYDKKKPTFDDDVDYHMLASGRLDHDDDEDDRIAKDSEQRNDEVATEEGTKGRLSKADKKKLKKRERAQERKAEAAYNQDGEAQENASDTEGTDELALMHPSERKRKIDEMMDDYYGLDYEDVIADQPTRFRYTEVPKSDYGMSAAEILLADDADLNNVVGLKRLQPYRRGNGKKGPADLKARLNEFRRNFDRNRRATETNVSGSHFSDTERRKVKKAGKRERERKKAAAAKAQVE